ncbi:ankyrin repeat domain-containing protein [Bdellovibrio sp. SKB1291214]|uniref:ankyrin repeat domain-containing protein n=1 Tax=Bdellovibrio sp. SKB1291214 TaxID=1732569 RepID=UPI000B51BC23|nr:ankyrin repeat domain-containing protein [Bdellovibrio sp. SKB1291214]UYL08697.1 ankyrin repeat domain-containing protein [Bdellovibrio sp. SKB1291214]
MINVAIWIFYVLVAIFTVFGPVRAKGSTIDDLNKSIELQKNVEVKNVIQTPSFDPGMRDDESMTPLMTAAMHGNTTAVKLLLDKKANLEQRNKFGDTALALAVSNDQEATAKMLIAAGAQVDVAVLSDNKDTLLITAAKSSEKTTRMILQKNKKVINQTNALGNTALIESVRAGYTNIAKLLVQNGADVAIKNKEGKTALDLSKEMNNKSLVSLLSKKIKTTETSTN